MRERIETVVATSGTSTAAFNTRMTNLGSAFNDLGEVGRSGCLVYDDGGPSSLGRRDPGSQRRGQEQPHYRAERFSIRAHDRAV